MRFDKTFWGACASTTLFVLLWGSGAIFARLGLDHASAFAFLTLRFILALGVLLLAQIEPFLESEIMQPAFDNILPALFGALAVVYVSKNWKIAVTPLVFMIALFVLVPSLASSVGVLVPVGALIAIGVARILYKKGLL